jgi:uncharacterized membrane protein YGL010W
MCPILKDVAVAQQLIGHGWFEARNPGVQDVMMRSFYDGYAVDLHVADVVDCVARACQAVAVGLCLQEALSGEGKEA